MATIGQENYFGTANNFNADATGGLKPTTYLNFAGLTALWTKVKEYVDNNDAAVVAAAKAKIDANDAAVRSYIESLEINGVTVTSDKAEGTLGTSLEVTIDGSNITVGAAGSDYKDSKIDAAIGAIDGRLDAIDTKLEEGVVSGLTVEVTHGEYGDPAAEKAWVAVSEHNDATGDVTITVDDTALNEKIIALDEDIKTLTANAGVTNIAVKDVGNSADGAVNKGLVEISLIGSKDPVSPGADYVGDGSKRGDILITLDETALDEKLDTIDATIADEVADRKDDSILLAGSNAKIDADGKLAWKADVTQNYKDLTAVSARLDEMDANLVTKVEEGTSVENYVELTVTPSAADGDKSVVITLDDSALNDYVTTNESNLKALDGLTVNGKTIISVDSTADQVAVSSTPITLYSGDIKRSTADDAKSVEESLAEHDAAIAALASATHFIGVSDDADIADGVAKATIKLRGVDTPHTAVDGDIVIAAAKGGKEFIFYNGVWYELGDTTAEAARITALETWVDTNIISSADIDALFNGTVNADLKADTNTFTF